MKATLFIALFALLCYEISSYVSPPKPPQTHLLGSKECTWGPSYWCQNLTSAAGCHATKHCIQTVWIHKTLPPDTSSVCQTCLDMVKQARDQLESNETQELIKQVFEGTCALIHLKPIVKECDKIADEYIPDLIDTLASEMNPQVVCSVAGLCNNDRVHELLEAENNKVVKKMAPNTCDGCHSVVELLENKFNVMSRDEVLQSFLKVCSRMSSLSDACSNIIVTYFTEIYNHLQDNFNPTDVCLMAGECSAQFHTHTNVQITPMSHVGYVPINDKQDDLPCDLCEQLVGHLRDLLVANTTEDEFKRVLEGLCKQTNSFKDECLSLVDEYYQLAYTFLVSELNSTVVCAMAGICPRPGHLELDAPIVPLLPVETADKALEIIHHEKPLHHINMGMEGAAVKVMQTPEQAQLPIERLMPPHSLQVIYDKGLCAFCEYFFHYAQQIITSPSTEEEIKEAFDKLCYDLPSTVNETCVSFVNTYGNAAAALLAQEIDPSTICPLLRICPAADAKDVEVFMHVEKEDDKCPLCLFAVTKLEQMVKDNKTKTNIKEALDKLCSHLSQNLAEECTDFVSTYTDELVEMLIADLTPQEVCVYLKLCTDKKRPASSLEPRIVINGEIDTNEIPDDTAYGKPIIRYQRNNNPDGANPQCVLCEFVMSQIENELKDNKTDEAIKQAVRDVCKVMPKTIKTDCNNFVNQYADTIIQLLIQALEPQEICAMMNLCVSKNLTFKVGILDCAICRSVVVAIHKILANPTVDHDIDHVLEKACRALPSKNQARCHEIIELYGKDVMKLIIHLSNSKKVCEEIELCSAEISTGALVGGSKCTWGPSYWCEKEEHAKGCGQGAVTHCQQKVWLGERPSQ